MAELSGFEVLGLTKEIEFRLRGSYVNNIYSLGGAQVLRLRSQEGEDVWLLLSPTKGAWPSKKVSERGETTTFTSKLRSELERARFSGAGQAGLDRVFELRFEQGGSRKDLVLELMPPGNLIVKDDRGKILLIAREVRSPSRRLVRGGEYSPPGQRRVGPLQLAAGELSTFAGEEDTAGKALGKHVAIPRKYVMEALARAGLSEQTPSKELAGKEEKVIQTFHEIVSEIAMQPRAFLCQTETGTEVFAVRPVAFKVEREFASLSELCDEVLFEQATAIIPETGKEDEAARHQATLAQLRKQEAGLMSEALSLRQTAKQALAAGDADDAAKVLELAGVKARGVPSSASAAASLAYDRAKEAEKKASDVRGTIEKLSKIAPKSGPKGPRRTRLAVRKQEWFEKFRWFRTSSGKLALGGRDAGSNSTLVRKHMQAGDVVFHADLFGSPFFVLKGGESMDESDSREVATATVAFSSAWKTGLASADAYWVSPDQVATAAPSGEFLARGSFAIKGKKNYVTKNAVELAVGVDKEGRVAAGPESPVALMCDSYVVLRPHREKASDTAKKVLKEIDPKGEKVLLDEVLRALPSGGGKIIRKGPHSALRP